MVAKTIEPEVVKALKCVENNKNFVLTGGAGSGKTYSLISLIEEVGEKYPLKSIVCITYTNNAVAEIRNRITNHRFHVSTIHEYVWSIISKYQKEIKIILVELINDESQKDFKTPKDFSVGQKITIDYFSKSKIEYDDYYSLKNDDNSKVSHDHILIIAERIFERYSKMSDILKDVADFIFVDEYQDTDPLIKDIFLTHINQSSKRNVIGFFGDSMQAIYENGVGEIVDNGLEYIQKKQNRRNPVNVINLANKIREDDLKQEPSADPKAPNMFEGKAIIGSVTFIYGDNTTVFDNFRESEYFSNWDFCNSKETKELWLVHRANAKMSGFIRLFNLYNSDLLIELINKIQKKVDEGQLVTTTNISFEEIAIEADISVRNRGNLLDNIMKNSDYQRILSLIKYKTWEEVSRYRINKESLLSYKFNGVTGFYEAKTQRDKILRKLDSIYELIELYKDRKYNDFLRRIKRKALTFDDKTAIGNEMEGLLSTSLTIEEVVSKANAIFKLETSDFDDFIIDQGYYLWERIKELPFYEYSNSIEYQKEYLPFATQHSIKGSEFNNVLVVLDNGNWNKYNFEKMFQNFDLDNSVVKRTRKLFYVCCTRAKKNLVIFMPSTNSNVIEKAKELFGEENVHYISNE